ncbi:MAG: hypothetical protein HPM95_15210 [Alphaproteobacteria bacterium]|nr:hypothetical protein [Alphaproteobacteria bacterium]
MNERTYANYERGDNEPDLTFLTRLIELEAVSAQWLITGEGEMREPVILAEKALSTNQIRKLIWNIAATFWEELPSRTKSFDVADQFVEMFDYLISRQNVKDDAASEVIHFGVERLKRTSGRDDS